MELWLFRRESHAATRYCGGYFTIRKGWRGGFLPALS
ncbi:MAG: hypothetical protein ACI9C3_000719, partial [Yoonia sp.]